MIKNLRKKAKNKKGFTLVELVVVIVIILVLAAVLIPNMLKYIDRANKANCKADAATILSQVQADFASSQADEAGIAVEKEYNKVPVDVADNLTSVDNNKAIYTVGAIKAVAGEQEFKEVTGFAYNNGKYTAKWENSKWSVAKNAAEPNTGE